MTRFFLPAAALSAAVLFSGCAQHATAPLYNYGTYSQDYYAYKKNMSDETALKLQKTMEEAIANPQAGRSGRVPPGMYANLGYLYLQQGQNAQARSSFEAEKRVYPESARFMDRLILKINMMEGDANATMVP